MLLGSVSLTFFCESCTNYNRREQQKDAKDNSHGQWVGFPHEQNNFFNIYLMGK